MTPSTPIGAMVGRRYLLIGTPLATNYPQVLAGTGPLLVFPCFRTFAGIHFVMAARGQSTVFSGSQSGRSAILPPTHSDFSAGTVSPTAPCRWKTRACRRNVYYTNSHDTMSSSITIDILPHFDSHISFGLSPATELSSS